MKRQCKICHKKFTIRSSRHIYCSEKCHKIQQKIKRSIYTKTKKYINHLKEYRKKPRVRKALKQSINKYRQTQKYAKSLKRYYLTNKYKQWCKSKKLKRYHTRYLKKWNKTPLGCDCLLRHSLKRRADSSNIIESFSIKQWKEKVSLTKNICPTCKYPFDDNKHKLSLDHFYPVQQASEDFKKTGIKRIYTINDIQPLCLSCNSKKGNKIIKPKDLNTIFTFFKTPSEDNKSYDTQNRCKANQLEAYK